MSINGIEPRSGMTRDGMPLSLNRAPAPDLEPWIARIVVANIDTPAGFRVQCGICNDIAFQRIMVDGDWEVHGAKGRIFVARESLLLGPHSKHMAASCEGSICSVNVGFRPGAIHRLFGRSLHTLTDEVEKADPLELAQAQHDLGYPSGASAQTWLQSAEERARAFIARIQPDPPDPISTAFERASFVDPNIAPSDFADQHSISLRKLERLVRRDFGLPPRTVLRRARALDLASHLLGIADEAEEADFLLRYFDQSHAIREFQTFFGVTPMALRKSQPVLLTINIETRAARRLEELERLDPSEPRPWQASGERD